LRFANDSVIVALVGDDDGTLRLTNAPNVMREDALQKRIERFVARVDAPKSLNREDNVCLGSTLGAVRKQNQDRALVVFASYSNEPDRNFTLAVLADGMGGLPHGEEAAITGLSVFTTRILRTPKLQAADRLRSAVLSANNAVHSSFHGRSGTTISAVLIDQPGRLMGVNVGDSRVYGLTPGNHAVQLSQDDTIAGVLGNKGQSGLNQNQLVQYVGMGEGVEPHIIPFKGRDFTTVLLTSDGIHGAQPDKFLNVVRESSSNFDLIEKLLAFNQSMGGRDNGTALLLPAHTSDARSDGEQGLNLTFLSTANRLEVWIPLLGYDYRQERVPDSNRAKEVQDSPQLEEVKTPSANAVREKKARKNVRERKRVRKGRKRDSTNEDPNLPLEEPDLPALNIKFPKTD
jgi:PPM family protein phosphatase